MRLVMWSVLSACLGLCAVGVARPVVAARQGVLVTEAPPSPMIEIRPQSPGPDHVWQAGYWRWSGRDYCWIAGRWAERPTLTAEWVPGRWQRRADKWIWVAGFWRGLGVRHVAVVQGRVAKNLHCGAG